MKERLDTGRGPGCGLKLRVKCYVRQGYRGMMHAKPEANVQVVSVMTSTGQAHLVEHRLQI